MQTPLESGSDLSVGLLILSIVEKPRESGNCSRDGSIIIGRAGERQWSER